MDIGPFLRSTEDPDSATVDSMVGQNVDDDIQALSRCVAAHRRRTDRAGDEAGFPFLLENDLALGLAFGVIGQRFERQTLGDLGIVLDAIHARRRSVDKPLHPRSLGRAYQRSEGSQVDGRPQIGVELKGGIVGYTGEVNDGIAAFERSRDGLWIPDVAFDLPQERVGLNAT